MKLTTMKELMQNAKKEHYAVPAFNICNLETVQGVLEQAEKLHAPVILQTHWSEAYYSSPETLVQMILGVGKDMDVTVAVHLDHGSSYEDTVRCIRGGFTSVMYDGSLLPLEENIRNLKKVTELAAYVNVTVEGEIGTIGQTSEMGEKLEKSYLTDPADAGKLAEQTGIDCLAVAIGNAHGFYSEAPNLDFERLREITEQTDIPLVLHGGTGLPKDQVQKAVTMGICKVNFSTVLRKTFIDGMKTYMAGNPEDLGLMNIMQAGKEAMKAAVQESMEICMCIGKV